MSEERVKRFTANYCQSEREQRRLKRKSGKAESNCDLSTTKPESTRDSTVTRTVRDQPSDTTGLVLNTLSKVKVSRKRKRTDGDTIWGQSVNSVAGPPEFDAPKNKKREEFQEEAGHRPPCPDPAIDESLSEQSRRALSYVYERYWGTEVWKFNKARQNWLLRNIWSEQAVPENYMPLLIEYLAGVKGGAKEKLIEECISKISTSERATIQGPQPSDDSGMVGSAIDQRANTSRAQTILRVLKNN